MPLVFANGGAPTFPGISFSNTEEAFTIIRDTLVSAGWTVLSGSPTSPPVRLQSGIAVNGVYCVAELISVSTTNFRIGGAHHNNLSIVSNGDLDHEFPSAVGHFRFNNGEDNRLWITADEDTAVIIMNPQTVSGATNFRCLYIGRLDLNNPNDGWAWVVENFGRTSGFGSAGYIAKTYISGINWASKSSAVIDQVGLGHLSIPLFTNRIASVQVDSPITSFANFNLANNYKLACGQVAYNYDGRGFFRGFFKFMLNGFTGLNCRTIHTRYIPESNQIAYYMAVANRVNPVGNANLGALIALS
jgi:hypothetical protein